MIEILDDGFEEVTVNSTATAAEGGQITKPIDVYLVAYAISDMSQDSKAKNEPPGVWNVRLVELLASQGLPGMSVKGARQLADALLKRLEDIEGKSEATPPPE